MIALGAIYSGSNPDTLTNGVHTANLKFLYYILKFLYYSIYLIRTHRLNYFVLLQIALRIYHF